MARATSPLAFAFASAFAFLALIPLPLALSGCATVTDADPEELPEKDVVSLRLNMADALVKQRDYDKALPYLRDLRQRYPKLAAVRRLLGEVLREKGMPEAADVEVRKALELGPGDPENYSALGVLLDKRGKHKAAEAAHRKALKMSHENPRYHNNLGFCLFLQKNLEDAEESVRDAIRLNPGLRVAYNNLGFIYGMMDKEPAALEAFKQAGHQAQALTNMGLVKEMRGQPGAARQFYEKALTHRPDYEPALTNLKALQPQVSGDGGGGDNKTGAKQ